MVVNNEIFEGGERRQLSGYRWLVDRRQRLKSNPKSWTEILSSNWTEKTSTEKLIYHQ